MISKRLNWRNKFLDPNYKLTATEKIIGWGSFFGFGILFSYILF